MDQEKQRLIKMMGDAKLMSENDIVLALKPDTKMMSDDINHPKRYAKGKIECIDAIESATMDLVGIEAFCTGNVIKYVWRWKDKEQIDSLKKARWYLDHLIQHLEDQ